MNRIDRILEVALGAAFALAGGLKVLGPSDFAGSLASLNLVPSVLLGPVAILLPWVELVAGVALLLTRRYRDAATALILGMLAIFTLVLGVELARGRTGSCGCFGTPIGFLDRPDVGLVRNLILTAVAATLAARKRKPTSREGPASPA